jgi:hypothetical protein
MGTYFNPPDDLPKVARPIHGGTYQELTEQLNDGEQLFGLYDRYVFKYAVHLFSPGEFEEFESRVRRGAIMRLGFYAMPSEVFETL